MKVVSEFVSVLLLMKRFDLRILERYLRFDCVFWRVVFDKVVNIFF